MEQLEPQNSEIDLKKGIKIAFLVTPLAFLVLFVVWFLDNRDPAYIKLGLILISFIALLAILAGIVKLMVTMLTNKSQRLSKELSTLNNEELIRELDLFQYDTLRCINAIRIAGERASDDSLIIRKLEEDGEIITPRGGDEIIV